MTDFIEPGFAEDLAVDPAGVHFALSEQAEYRLRTVAEALRCAQRMCDAFEVDRDDLVPVGVGALFGVCGEYLAQLLATGTVHFPARSGETVQ